MPRFSVVVPTRDRPDFLGFCLEGLAAQTFADFEVIVSDNFVESPARAVFDQWARPGWRYVRPEQPVPMHDNFEHGCANATGEWVAVMLDKTVPHPSALEIVNAALEAEPSADLVTWRNEGYMPVDESLDLGTGRLRPVATVVAPTLYDPAAELARRFANESRRGTDFVHYVRGKIVFGAYSRALVDRIRQTAGRVFHPLSPDYTSMVPACVLSNGALDVGRPLLVSYNSVRSNGQLCTLDSAHARRFVESANGPIVGELPIPGLYTSLHNIVAHDLVSSGARCPPGSTPELHFVNLLHRAREDLDDVMWVDPAERAAQYSILELAESRFGVTPTPPLPTAPPGPAATAEGRTLRQLIAERVYRIPPVERMLDNRSWKPFTYSSPVEAADAADRHYGAIAAATAGL